uniref:Protein diaphanous 2 n=1 Tax=Sphaerodactylus townsendi TaxID=933632 RepID=A0ACB8FYN4_9SAUR
MRTFFLKDVGVVGSEILPCSLCCHVFLVHYTVASPVETPSGQFVNLQIKTLADDVRDRITSFRKSGVKKEKLLIQHPIDTPASINELPAAQPLFDERSMNLSEKEVMDLFEKMMEDMNLNEERKAPLRNKDLTTKREMVVQYISATAKSVEKDPWILANEPELQK